MIRHGWGCLATCIVVGTITGCGGERQRPSAEIEGQVRLDGEPLPQGSVHFTSAKSGETAYANLDSEGRYSVHFDQVDIGEVYAVSVSEPVIDEQDAHALEQNPPEPMTVDIPQKYTNRMTSGLSVTIDEGGTHEFDIDMSSS